MGTAYPFCIRIRTGVGNSGLGLADVGVRITTRQDWGRFARQSLVQSFVQRLVDSTFVLPLIAVCWSIVTVSAIGMFHNEVIMQSQGFSSRRTFLARAGGGAGMLAYAALCGAENSAVVSHEKPRARRVIWLFMHGGPSHVDLFDPKPVLTRYAGQPLPESFGNVMTRRNVAKNPLMAPVRRFRPRGDSGLEISDFLPHLAAHADDLCVVRSLHGDSVNHPQSVYQMNTGSIS